MAKLNYDTKTVMEMDNIIALRYTDSETIDLVYLDPPFNSGRVFSRPIGKPDFDDKWSIDRRGADRDREELEHLNPPLAALVAAIPGESNQAYLRFMAVRLIEIRRILKPTGNMVLHCDDTMSSHLRLVCDIIFGSGAFRNEIIWRRSKAKKTSRKLARSGDRLLVYGMSDGAYLNVPHAPLSEEYIRKSYRHDDGDGKGRYQIDNLAAPAVRPNLQYDYKGYSHPANGWRVERKNMERYDEEGRLAFPKTKDGRIRLKRYLSESEGVPIGDIWTDIGMVQKPIYSTEKPLALLERIITAYCPDDGIVFDPFCGCATTIVAAQKLGMDWVGCDLGGNAHTAIADRLSLGDAEVRRRAARRKADGRTSAEDEAHQLLTYRELGISKGRWEGGKLLATPPGTAAYRSETVHRRDLVDGKTREHRLDLLDKQGNRCAITGEPIDSKTASWDRIITGSRGGHYEVDNLRLVTRGANSSRGDRAATKEQE